MTINQLTPNQSLQVEKIMTDNILKIILDNSERKKKMIKKYKSFRKSNIIMKGLSTIISSIMSLILSPLLIVRYFIVSLETVNYTYTILDELHESDFEIVINSDNTVNDESIIEMLKTRKIQ